MSMFTDNMRKYWQYRRALDIATDAHKGQTRRGTNRPYIDHPKSIVQRMEQDGIDDSIYHAVALLHDVLEDTDITEQQLSDKGISDDIITAVKLLTKKKDQSYQSYLSELKKNDIAKTVKIYDMIDNLSDMPTERQKEKYRLGLEYLKNGEKIR